MNKKIKLMQLCVMVLGLWSGQSVKSEIHLKKFTAKSTLNTNTSMQSTIPIEKMIDQSILQGIDTDLNNLWKAFNLKNDLDVKNSCDSLYTHTIKSNNDYLKAAYNDIITVTENNDFYQLKNRFGRAINKMKQEMIHISELQWPIAAAAYRPTITLIPLELVETEEPSLYYSTRYAARAPWDWTKGTVRSGIELGKGAWSGIKGGIYSAKEWFSPSLETKLEVQRELNEIYAAYDYLAIEEKVEANKELSKEERDILRDIGPKVYALRKQIEGWQPTLIKAGVLGAAAGAAYLKSK